MSDPTPTGRRLETPAGGHTLFAQQHDGDYRVVDAQGQQVGFMRRVMKTRWAIALTYNDDFTGQYADMPHAAQGLLSRRRDHTL